MGRGAFACMALTFAAHKPQSDHSSNVHAVEASCGMVRLNWSKARKAGAVVANRNAERLEKQATALLKAADAAPGPEAIRAMQLARKLRRRQRQLAKEAKLAKKAAYAKRHRERRHK